MASLLNFNAWGMVSVGKQAITVILSATDGSRVHNRTIKRESERLDFTGSALIAIDITADSYKLTSRELEKVSVANHPEVVKVLSDAVSWIRQSVGM